MSAANDVAVKVENVSKVYGLWSSPSARLRGPLVNMASHSARSFSNSLADRLKAKSESMFREFHALKDVSLEIKKGESWGFIGVNGSGKSTLLKMISGNLRPSSGRIEVDGKVAILDYSSGLHGEFTGRENIYLKGAILGMTRKEVESKIASIEAFADIGDFIDQPVKTYSSGMQARLGFAIIAHVEADILITDEALAVGDAFFVQKCMRHIREFIAKGTFLFVSHAINDVLSLCEKAVWLANGNIMAIGPAKVVADQYMNHQVMKRSQDYLSAGGAQEDDQNSEASAVEASEIILRQPALSARMHARAPRVVRDQRAPLINASKLRNDIQLPDVPLPSATGYGVGGAVINGVEFEDDSGSKLSWILGSEIVSLRILLQAQRDLRSPIVGFQVKDRLGQIVFADNTYLTTLERPFTIPGGQKFGAEFRFQMPLLPVGEYAIRAAIADGTESNNAMLHVIDEALVFRSVTSGARHGLVGVPMEYVRLFADDELA